MLYPNPMLLLAGSLDFTAEDLFANRAGRISARQRDLLQRRRAQVMLRWLMAAAVWAGLGLLLHLEIFTIGFIAACLMSGAALHWQRFDADMRERVESRTGWLHIRQIPAWLARRWRVCVEEDCFDIPAHSRTAFDDRRRYRLYYAAGSRTLLSAEVAR
jgi:hypothetical protein